MHLYESFIKLSCKLTCNIRNIYVQAGIMILLSIAGFEVKILLRLMQILHNKFKFS